MGYPTLWRGTSHDWRRNARRRAHLLNRVSRRKRALTFALSLGLSLYRREGRNRGKCWARGGGRIENNFGFRLKGRGFNSRGGAQGDIGYFGVQKLDNFIAHNLRRGISWAGLGC